MGENTNENNVQYPTDQPVMVIPEETRLFGRRILYADYTEEQINKHKLVKKNMNIY